MNKEQNWIDEVMNVSSRIETPSIPEHVLGRIQRIPIDIQAKIDRVPPRTMWLAAASIAALVAVNLYFFSTTGSVDQSTNSFGETYFSYTKQL